MYSFFCYICVLLISCIQKRGGQSYSSTTKMECAQSSEILDIIQETSHMTRRRGCEYIERLQTSLMTSTCTIKERVGQHQTRNFSVIVNKNVEMA